VEEVLYDTSILIESVRKNAKRLRGYTTIFNVMEFPKAIRLDELKVLYPMRRDYDEALKLSVRLLEGGKPIPSIDILIAAMCNNRNLTLVTKDKHFLSVKLIKEDFKINIVE